MADAVYVPMYIYKRLYLTAGLYMVFLVLAIVGLIEWKRSHDRQRSPACSTG